MTVWHSLSRVFQQESSLNCVFIQIIFKDVRYGAYHMDNIISYLVSVVPDVPNESLFNF